MKRRLIRKGRIDASAVAAEVDDEIIAQVRGTAPAGETLGTLRDGKLAQVSSKSDMSSIDFNDVTFLVLRETEAARFWQWDSSDLSSGVSDDPRQGWLVAPASDTTGASGAWVARFDGLPHVEWWHQSGDDTGGVNYSPAFNAAFAAGARSVTTYDQAILSCRDPLDINFVSGKQSIRISAPTSEIRHYSNQSLFDFDNAIFVDMDLYRVRIMSGASYVFNNCGFFTNSKFRVREVINSEPTAGVIFGDDNANRGVYSPAFYTSDVIVERYLAATTGNNPQPGARLVDLSTSSVSARDSRFEFGFLYGPNDNVAIRCHSNSPDGSLNLRNKWIVRTGETSVGGLVDLGGEMGSLIDVTMYDVGVVQNHIVTLQRSSGSNRRCIGNTVRYTRRAGTIGAFKDVYIPTDGAENTIVEMLGQNTGASQMIVDCGDTTVTALNAAYTAFENTASLINLNEKKSLLDTTPGLQLTLASGEITIASNASQVWRKVRSEGGAATDDLTLINGGFEGQILILSTHSNAEDITLVSSADIRLDGTANKLLDRTDDTIALLCTAPDTWRQIGYADTI